MEGSAVLNSKVSALEDEMRIIKGEVKQVLTEIRSAILVQDSPFEETPTRSRPVQIVPAVEPTRVEIVMPHEPEPAPTAKAAPAEPAPLAAGAAPHEAAAALHAVPSVPSALHAGGAAEYAAHAPAPAHAHAAAQPRWTLLTIANLAAWAEEAIQKVGPQRLSILLDLCEVSGYLTPEARQALAGVAALEIEVPAQPASPMEVTVLLRQLDALLQGESPEARARLLY